MAYEIEFSPEALEHLALLTARLRAIVVDQVEVQLTHQPDVPTRNRKPMRIGPPPPIAPWELRLGDVRVYYEFETDPARRVDIRAIGIKVRNRIRIGRQEFEP